MSHPNRRIGMVLLAFAAWLGTAALACVPFFANRPANDSDASGNQSAVVLWHNSSSAGGATTNPSDQTVTRTDASGVAPALAVTP